MNLHDFHFTQPLWLLMVIPVIIAASLVWRRQSREGNWQQVIDPALLPYLLTGMNKRQRGSVFALLFGWLLACVALAGPSWEKLPQPLLQKQDALVILLDLSYSMYAEDVQPSRIVRARQKILDILKRRKEGLTALVSFAGDAHVVSPLTDDIATIANLVPALSPDMMPALGSNPAAAVKTGLELLKNSELKRGRLLLISDALTEKDVSEIRSALSGKDIQLSLLAVGTAQGAPIPVDNGFLRNNDGTIVVPGLNVKTFEELASDTGAPFSELQLDDSDLNTVLPATVTPDEEMKIIEQTSDQWRNRGPWLVMLLLPLAALAFRRGWLLALCIAPLFTHSPDASAMDWQDLWKTPDQQAAELLQKGDAKAASERFKNPDWQASALYQAGDYPKAAEAFDASKKPDAKKTPNQQANDFYNQGNALARSGKLDDAIAAYDKALKTNPNDDDAKFNKALVEKLKQQQEQKKQDQQQNQDSTNQNSKDQNSQDKDSKNQQSKDQNQQQQNQDQKQDQQSKDQQQSENGQSKDQQQSNDQQSSSDKKSDEQKNADQNFQQQSEQDKQNQAQQQKEQQQKEQDQDQDQKQDQEKQQAAQSKEDEQQSPEEKAKAEQQQAAQAGKEEKSADEKKDAEQAAVQSAEQLEKEQKQQATEQWLRQIPDDPGGLMRRKFQYEYEQQQRNGGMSDEDQQQW